MLLLKVGTDISGNQNFPNRNISSPKNNFCPYYVGKRNFPSRFRIRDLGHVFWAIGTYILSTVPLYKFSQGYYLFKSKICNWGSVSFIPEVKMNFTVFLNI